MERDLYISSIVPTYVFGLLPFIIVYLGRRRHRKRNHNTRGPNTIKRKLRSYFMLSSVDLSAPTILLASGLNPKYSIYVFPIYNDSFVTAVWKGRKWTKTSRVWPLLKKNFLLYWGSGVAQLGEKALLTPEVCSSNAVIGKFLNPILHFCWLFKRRK